ncbi:MAG: TolC family protein [Spirochaetaceae bacterium]|nr:TolC family protein [Spirochaetaceae bacterium]
MLRLCYAPDEDIPLRRVFGGNSNEYRLYAVLYIMKRGALILAALCVIFPVEAQEAEMMVEDGSGQADVRIITLDEALAMAEKSNLMLQKSAIDVKTALRSKNNLWAEIFPSFSAGLSTSYGSIGIVKPAAREASASWGVSAGISLQLNAALSARMRLLQLALQSSQLSYESSKTQLATTVSKAFYQLLANERGLQIQQDRLSQAEREAAQARTKFNNGLLSELNFRRAQFSVEQAKYESARTESAYKQALGDFLIILGFVDASFSGEGGMEDATGRGVKLEGAITITRRDMDAHELSARFLPERPDIAAAKRALEQAKLNHKSRLLQGKTPSISVSSRYSGNPAANSAEYEDGVSFSLSLNIPIDGWIPNTTAHQNITAAAADIEKAGLDLKNIEIEARRSIRSLCETLRNSWNNIEIARLGAGIAERTYEMSARGFRDGAVDFILLEADRSSLAQARQTLLLEELSYKLTELDLAQALNVSIDFFESEDFVNFAPR